jgi:hypothetical protein
LFRQLLLSFFLHLDELVRICFVFHGDILLKLQLPFSS